jgi:hypothetical protein
MVDNPLEYINELENLNVEYITFHIEIEKDIDEIITKIKELGYKVGISIKPNSDINTLTPYLDKIDLILVMSVEPGKGGQEFIPGTKRRLELLKELIKDKNILLEVDGGINNETIKKIKLADIAVVGSYIIKSSNYNTRINKLLNKREKTFWSLLLDNTIVLLIMCLLYIILGSIYASINGYQGICILECEKIYGINAFTNSLLMKTLFILLMIARYIVAVIIILFLVTLIRFSLYKAVEKIINK